MRGAWIEIRLVISNEKEFKSLPLRGAWIEIKELSEGDTIAAVAPLAGGVD